MVDLTFLEKFTKGDSVKMKRYIVMYLTETPTIFEKINEFLQNKDWSNLAICAHSLKPQVEFMGIIELKEMLVEIENNVKNESFKPLHDLIQKAISLHLKSMTILRDHLDKL